MSDLTLYTEETADSIRGSIEYRTDLFDPDRITRMAEHLRLVLEQMVMGPVQRIDDLSLLTGAEREQVLVEWNRTAVKYPQHCLHELFEEQAARTPEAVAVEYEGRQLTYRELDRQANQLAHYLQALGVKPEMRVALCVERGLEMIVGLMAILKAGGAYVPLDPAYPQERLQYMLENSVPVALLTQSQVRLRLGPLPAGLHTLDVTDISSWASQ